MTASRVPMHYQRLALAGLGWLLLWPLTPGLLSWNIGTIFTPNEHLALLLSIVFSLLVLFIVILFHKQATRQLFAKHRTVLLYVAPVIALPVLPFRVDIMTGSIFGLPPLLYVGMITANVLFQQYITFGLFQTYAEKALSKKAVIIVTALVFCVGHVLFLPQSFGVHQLPNLLFILALGITFAALRARTRTLHTLLSLHLLFYYVMI